MIDTLITISFGAAAVAAVFVFVLLCGAGVTSFNAAFEENHNKIINLIFALCAFLLLFFCVGYAIQLVL